MRRQLVAACSKGMFAAGAPAAVVAGAPVATCARGSAPNRARAGPLRQGTVPAEALVEVVLRAAVAQGVQAGVHREADDPANAALGRSGGRSACCRPPQTDGVVRGRGAGWRRGAARAGGGGPAKRRHLEGSGNSGGCLSRAPWARRPASPPWHSRLRLASRSAAKSSRQDFRFIWTSPLLETDAVVEQARDSLRGSERPPRRQAGVPRWNTRSAQVHSLRYGCSETLRTLPGRQREGEVRAGPTAPGRARFSAPRSSPRRFSNG